MKTRNLLMIAMIVAVSVTGRLYMSFIPNVQPVTSIIIITSIVLGYRYALTVAILVTLISDIYLGVGFWTVSQIVAFSLIAILSGLFMKWKESKNIILIVVIIGLLSGLFFGMVMSLFNYILFDSFWAYYIGGLPFDLYHALGNMVIISILYYPLKKIFDIFKNKERFYYENY